MLPLLLLLPYNSFTVNFDDDCLRHHTWVLLGVHPFDSFPLLKPHQEHALAKLVSNKDACLILN